MCFKFKNDFAVRLQLFMHGCVTTTAEHAADHERGCKPSWHEWGPGVHQSAGSQACLCGVSSIFWGTSCQPFGSDTSFTRAHSARLTASGDPGVQGLLALCAFICIEFLGVFGALTLKNSSSTVTATIKLVCVECCSLERQHIYVDMANVYNHETLTILTVITWFNME